MGMCSYCAPDILIAGDIEDFINWKVLEEQKVASIVAGSKMHERELNGIFAAIRDGSATVVTDHIETFTPTGIPERPWRPRQTSPIPPRPSDWVSV